MDGYWISDHWNSEYRHWFQVKNTKVTTHKTEADKQQYYENQSHYFVCFPGNVLVRSKANHIERNL
jgi:hypothetical protein